MIPDNQKRAFVNELATHFSLILLKEGEDFDIGGNAVVIAPWIAITAAHVLLNNKFGSFSNLGTREEGGQHFPDESLNILVHSAKYKKYFLLNVKRAVVVNDTDLAILYLNEKTDNIPNDIWNEITLNLTPPDVNNHVFTIGTVVNKNSPTATNGVLSIDPEYIASFGAVTEFMLKRPFTGPGLYSKLTAPNTLSGSPVFNNKKELIGLISLGSGTNEDPSTFISILYPLLTSRHTVEGIDAFHLYRLATDGVIRCLNLDRVKIIDQHNVDVVLPRSLKET